MERPWTSFYGPSVRAEIDELPFRNLGDLVSHTASVYGDAPAFTVCLPNGMNGTLSFRQVDEMSDALAIYLREVAGLEAGDRVACRCPTGCRFPVAAFAVFKAGCVLVNVNPLYTAEEMGKQFEDAKPRRSSSSTCSPTSCPSRTRATRSQHHRDARGRVLAVHAARDRGAGPEILGQVHRTRSSWPISACPTPSRQAPRRTGRRPCRGLGLQYAHLDPDDVAVLQYTGGTTGVSKGAMLTHRNLIMNMAQTIEMISGVKKGEEVALTALPMYHIFAFTVNLLGLLLARCAQPPHPQSAAAVQSQARIRELQDHLDERGQHAVQRVFRTRSGFSTRRPSTSNSPPRAAWRCKRRWPNGGRRLPASRSSRATA
jgi:long-chain acyl-CoA synthetase